LAEAIAADHAKKSDGGKRISPAARARQHLREMTREAEAAAAAPLLGASLLDLSPAQLQALRKKNGSRGRTPHRIDSARRQRRRGLAIPPRNDSSALADDHRHAGPLEEASREPVAGSRGPRAPRAWRRAPPRGDVCSWTVLGEAPRTTADLRLVEPTARRGGRAPRDRR
jgi:hypothetical protein